MEWLSGAKSFVLVLSTRTQIFQLFDGISTCLALDPHLFFDELLENPGDRSLPVDPAKEQQPRRDYPYPTSHDPPVYL